MFRKRLQLGLIHVAVAITLVPINSTLNRVLIKEMAVSATLVAILAILPYLFSPIQVWIGSFSDRHPIFGYRRTPYILLGLLLCVLGVAVSPQVAFLLDQDRLLGTLVGILVFGAWGMGYNFSAVCYLSLASEISGEKGRGRTIAVMFVMMIIGIILTALTVSQLVDPYTPAALQNAFLVVALAALVLGLFGMLKLEEKVTLEALPSTENYSWGQMFGAILQNRQATFFFWYLVILLAAILGQDILLEPFGAEAFEMSVKTTTRITSIWGACNLLTLVLAGILEGRVQKKTVARWGGWLTLFGFVLILSSGLMRNTSVFYSGVILLGSGTGLATVSNLSLMLDMTTPANVGLYIGAWGMANALSRLIGTLLSGVVRDLVTQISQSPLSGYLTVFGIEAFFIAVSLVMLGKISVEQFRKASVVSVVERAALASDL
ncbi:MAG: BCD family MFS transporter [Anaerolineales bacterium]